MENIDNAVDLAVQERNALTADTINNVDLDKFEQRVLANEIIEQDETDIGADGLVEEPEVTVH